MFEFVQNAVIATTGSKLNEFNLKKKQRILVNDIEIKINTARI